MLVHRTPDTLALAEAVRARVKADARAISGRAAIWQMAGHGILALGAGLGLGAILFGYSYITDKRVSDMQTEAAISRALAQTTLKLEIPPLQLSPDAVLGLKPDQFVALAPGTKLPLSPDATVKLDPHSKVTVDITGALPRPSDSQMAASKTTPSNGTVVTDFTIFHTVDFPPGKVVTGWKFDDTTQARPSSQYCYFSRTVGKNSEASLYIGDDGRFTPPKGVPNGVDVKAAFQHCVWN